MEQHDLVVSIYLAVDKSIPEESAWDYAEEWMRENIKVIGNDDPNVIWVGEPVLDWVG